MDKVYALRSIFCLFSLIFSVSSAFKQIFGPPKVTLQCSADYVTLNKVVGVSWLPTLLSNETSISTETVNSRVQNCEAGITCSGGYNKPPIGCTYNTTNRFYLLKWELSVPFHETSCSVQVSYLDHEDYHGTVHMTRKSCSYSAPNSTIFKKSSPVSATVGKPYWIQCSVHTSEKVNSSVVKIDWSGPDGSITNDSRISIHPTLSDDGIVHNSTLQFVYLSQNDNGTFTCNVTILDTNISEAFQLNKITIPTPNISITALSNQMLNNNSLMLECNITTVRGITSNMDIVWMANNTIIRRMNDSLGKLINNVITHRDVCHVSNVGSDGTQYHCHAVINESLIVKGSFFSTKPSVSVPSPTTTSTSPTASMYTISNSRFIPTETSTANSSTENSSTENPPSTTAKTSAALAGTAQVAIIISVVIGFLIISFSICVIVYKFKRELHSKNHYSTNNSRDIHFKAPSVSDVRYSITDKDDASTCENLDLNNKVVGWMKSLQGPDLNEQCDESYPSNEEILNYVCGHNLKYCDSRQTINENVEYKKLSKAEEGLLLSSNHLTMTNNESILRIGQKTMGDHDVSVFYDKGSSQNIQTMSNNITEEDHAFSTSTVVSQNKPYVTLNTNTKLIPDKVCILHNTSCHCHCKYDYSEHDNVMLPVVEQVNHNLAQQGENLSEQKEAHKAILHACNDERTISMHMANSDQLSLDSSSKLTEETLTSSVSSCSINMSLAGGEYIENGSPSHRAIISCIPIQSPTNFHQNNVKHFDGNKCLTTTAIEGEYVDRNIAIQQSKHTTNKN